MIIDWEGTRRMRARMTLAVVSVAMALIPTAVAAPPPSHHTPIASMACTKARIGGKTKCIARGQFCARAHKRDYERYGLHCTKRDANGRWHLR